MSEAPELKQEPQPLGRSIMWRPATESGRAAPVPDPIFIAQAAVAALREHVAGAGGKSILGVLVGDVCESPEGDRHILISSTIKSNQAVQSDRTTLLLGTMWDQVRDQLKQTHGRLLGWYHTHAEPGVEMSSYDIETHERYFRDPWHVALVIGTANGQPAAGFFRKTGGDGWGATCLPFYEVQKEEGAAEGGKKRSYVVWKNYRAFAATGGAPRAKAAAARPIPAPRSPARAAPPPSEPEEPEEPDFDEAEESAEEPEPPAAPARKDSDGLQFLSAAEDAPPPAPEPARAAAPPPAPPPPPPPPTPQPAPMPQAPPPLPSQRGAVQGLVADGALFESQEMVAIPREPEPVLGASGARRRVSHAPRAPRKGLGVIFALVVVAALAGGGVFAYQKYAPQIALPSVSQIRDLFVQRIRQLLPKTSAPAPAVGQPPARPQTPAPSPVATQPPMPPPAPAVPAGPPSPALLQLDALADSLTLALSNYHDRVKLFENRQLDCLGLGRGLVAVENRHATYTAQNAVGGVVLDPARAARNQALRAAFDSAEQRFQQAHCTRP